MKYALTILTLFLCAFTFAQGAFPEFLKGTWKIENNEIYEHWDLLNENSLKGFSYTVENKKMVISEYLDISRRENSIIYTAAVLNQNGGREVEFKRTQADSVFIFENPAHDFPKKIMYQKISDTVVSVRVSGGEQQNFSYKMIKQTGINSGKSIPLQDPD